MPKTVKFRTPFAERLVRLRKGKGLTQRDLARLTDISPRVVAHYETNIKGPSADFVIRLAKGLDVSIDQLMGRKRVRESEPLIKNRNLLRKMKELDKLPTEEQKKIIRHIDDLKAKYNPQ